MLVPNNEFLGIDSVIEHQKENKKIWAKKDLVELANYFQVGPLTILWTLFENNLTTKSYYSEKHQAWNKPSFGKAKEPQGRQMHKESPKERDRVFVSLAFNAYDQNKIELKELSDFLGLRFAFIPKTRELLNA